MIKSLIVIVFFILAILEIAGVVSITTQTSRIVSVLVIIFVISCFIRINGASYFFLALLLVAVCIGALSLKEQEIAEKTAVWSYLFILAGLSISVFEYNNKNYKLYKKKR